MGRWRLEIEIALHELRCRTLRVRAEDDIPNVAPESRRRQSKRRADAMLGFWYNSAMKLAAAIAAWMACVARLFAGGAREDYAYLRASIGETCTAAEFAQLASAAGLTAAKRNFLLPACSCLLFRKNMVK